MQKAIILLSGGIDSATTLAIAENERYELYALSFDYGQRHSVELQYAKKLAKQFKVKQHLIIKFNLREIGGSALTSDIEVPKKGILDKSSNNSACQQIPLTYVPARNTIFLSFALSFAETLKSPCIFIGANVVDYSGYPDCRPLYLQAFEQMANLATKISVEKKIIFKIHAPLLYSTKSDIIKKGLALGLDYSLTWSCYDPQRPKNTSKLVPCGKCYSCLIRQKGFEEAGIKDPHYKLKY